MYCTDSYDKDATSSFLPGKFFLFTMSGRWTKGKLMKFKQLENISKDKSLLPGSIPITEQVEILLKYF